MSQNGNNGDIIEKKDLKNQKLGMSRYIDLEFSHKSVGGETFINFSSLTTPPEYTLLDGFTNPSPASLIESQIRYNKANVELSSTGERGKLFHREDYVIKSNGGIHLLYETEKNEVITGIIRSIVRNQPALIDASKIVKTGELAEGQTTFVIGDSFKLFDNPSEQLGAIVVMRFKGEETPQMMFRNDGNLPSGEGNYYEVDGGNNLCNTIEFNEAGQVDGENIVVYSYALQVGKPQTSYLAELETLGGQVDVISQFLTDVHALGSNIFQAVANRIDLSSFGRKVVNLEKIYEMYIVSSVPTSIFVKLPASNSTVENANEYQWAVGSEELDGDNTLVTINHNDANHTSIIANRDCLFNVHFTGTPNTGANPDMQISHKTAGNSLIEGYTSAEATNTSYTMFVSAGIKVKAGERIHFRGQTTSMNLNSLTVRCSIVEIAKYSKIKDLI